MFEFNQIQISAVSFYGGTPKCSIPDADRESVKVCRKERIRYPFKNLSVSSPSSVWKVFRKQDEAIHFAKKRMNGVMPFVCQSAPNGERSFLVAHPRVFWFHDCQKELRCSYEIICEHSLSKLYFDLEFCKETNPDKNGLFMTEVFIKIVNYFLKKEWSLECLRSQILDLDSSSDIKFSRHLIYQIPCVFQDNYHVGNFVKMICFNLQTLMAGEESQTFLDIGINKTDIKKLFINDKGKLKLFCDVSVYSKNRHFRLYRSAKWGKAAHLRRSDENQWLADHDDNDEKLFLDSLITYFPADQNLTILKYSSDEPSSFHRKNASGTQKKVFSPANRSESPFPEVDSFIRTLVCPGRVYRWLFSPEHNLVYYDIVGNRYCKNIGREHRSNNIRMVVDVKRKCFYQKCYDTDCRAFQSEPALLPTELLFALEGPLPLDETEPLDSLWTECVSEEDLEILDCVESGVISF